MRKTLWVAALLFSAGAAEAQNAELPKWDFNFNAGFFNNRPFEESRGSTFGDEWYGEGRRWTQEIIRIPGSSISHPIGTEVFHRLQQGSARAVWQFNENTWVHPYLNGGFVVDRERRTSRSEEQFYYPGDPRTRPPVLLRPAVCCGKVIDYRYGVTVGGGSTFYVSPHSYVNAGMQVTYAKPATTAAVLLGFGIDF